MTSWWGGASTPPPKDPSSTVTASAPPSNSKADVAVGKDRPGEEQWPHRGSGHTMLVYLLVAVQRLEDDTHSVSVQAWWTKSWPCLRHGAGTLLGF